MRNDDDRVGKVEDKGAKGKTESEESDEKDLNEE